ncbi:MAG: glycosyltransferase family 9 protein [Desulfatibacillaceae bacterium]
MARVLVIKMSALGDVVLATPQIEAVCAHHARDEVWLLTGPDMEGLFRHHPELRVAVLDRSDTFGTAGLFGRIRWARRTGFDVVYDLQGNRTSRRVARWSGAPKRVGTQPWRAYTHHPELPYTPEVRQNVFDRLNETIVSGGLPPAEPRGRLYPSPEDVEAAQRFMDRHGLVPGGFACIHPGSSPEWPSKRWPLDSVRDLARAIERAGVRCVFVGSGPDSKINRALAMEVGVDATEAFSVPGLYEFGGRARFAVCMDSAPMHVLAASGIPVYTIYGPTSPVRTHGLGQGGRVVSLELPCAPCYKGTCPPGHHHRCMAELTPDEVLRRISELRPEAGKPGR